MPAIIYEFYNNNTCGGTYILFKYTRLMFLTLNALLWFVSPCWYQIYCNSRKTYNWNKKDKLLPFSVFWANLSQVKAEREENRLAQDEIINFQKWCWLVEARWWCHGNEFPPVMRRALWERLHPPHRKAVPRNVSGRQSSLRFQSCGLKHDGYFMLRAVETHVFITSHQNRSRRRSFSRPVLLMKTVVWRSDPTLVLLHREVVLTGGMDRNLHRDLKRPDLTRIQQQDSSVPA